LETNSYDVIIVERVVTLLLDISKWKRHFTHPESFCTYGYEIESAQAVKIYTASRCLHS